MKTWLTEQEAMAYGGLSLTALQSRRKRKSIPTMRSPEGLWLHKMGPWLLPTTKEERFVASIKEPPAVEVVESTPAPVPKDSFFPREPVTEMGLETPVLDWLLQTLRLMPEREAGSLARQMILNHPGTPPEVKALITEFWRGAL